MTKTPPRAAGVLLLVQGETGFGDKTFSDLPYLTKLSSSLASCKVKVYDKAPTTITEIVLMARKAGLTHVITTRTDVLKKLLPEGREKKATTANYAGSILPFKVAGEITEFLILAPLKQLVTVPHGEFLAKRYIAKFTNPEKFRPVSEFNFKIVNDPLDNSVALSYLSTCDLIAVDIETAREPRPAITMVGYTGFKIAEGTSYSFVIPMKSMHAVHWMRDINKLNIPKVLQNGKYDLAYFFMYGAPVIAYLYDTANAFHAWYAELPKVLEAISAFFIRDSLYWKDLADSGDYTEKCRYNALDTWATGEAFLSWLQEAPDWAKRNYVDEFSVVPGCHMCEMTGIKRDMVVLKRANDAAEAKQEQLLSSIRKMVGTPNFNPSSPKQVLILLKALGEREAKSSDEAQLSSTMFKHPINERILGTILEYRGERKLSSTYLTVGDKAKEFGPPGKERILYSLNAHGTDTGRLASKEHHFWCGLQAQNVSAYDEKNAEVQVKDTMIADNGWNLWEADYSQAEDRGVAYGSGDPALLAIFASGKDSHKMKASMFFGVPYEQITKDQRQLGKRVNHGANYNMGAYILVQTMGPRAIRIAQALLGLPKHWDLNGVATYLLNVYDKTFPTVKGEYYDSIKKEVKTTHRLIGATGWTRYCFGDPFKNKMDLNAYVAHVTQSLNAMILNKAFLAVFRELAFLPEFKLLVQIHDSILFATRVGHDHLATRVQEIMTFPVPVTDCSGVTRDMLVPVDIKKLGHRWSGSSLPPS
jgi:DNA polymerase I-like protein with 3'-5' exonuclease and polymerase domains